MEARERMGLFFLTTGRFEVLRTMADARVWFPISAGLLTFEHCRRIGPAWMVFLWLIHEQRLPKDGEVPGVVRNGVPISYEVIGRCLHGMPRRTVEKHISVLEREGYIRSEYIRGHGKRYTIANPIRWEMALPRTGELKGSDSPEVGSGNPQQWGAVLPQSAEANKEAITNNVTTKSKAGAHPTLEQVSAYCKERNNQVNPHKWMAHYTANGWKVGRNNMVDWKAAVRTWEHNGVNGNGNRAEQRQASNLAALEIAFPLDR